MCSILVNKTGVVSPRGRRLPLQTLAPPPTPTCFAAPPPKRAARSPRGREEGDDVAFSSPLVWAGAGAAAKLRRRGPPARAIPLQRRVV
jgi:hypothetical protein